MSIFFKKSSISGKEKRNLLCYFVSLIHSFFLRNIFTKQVSKVSLVYLIWEIHRRDLLLIPPGDWVYKHLCEVHLILDLLHYLIVLVVTQTPSNTV